MRFLIEKNYMVLLVEEKAKSNLYTLIDLDNGDKVKALGVKSKVEKMQIVKTTLNLVVKNERFETKEGMKYVNALSMFIETIEQVKSK